MVPIWFICVGGEGMAVGMVLLVILLNCIGLFCLFSLSRASCCCCCFTFPPFTGLLTFSALSYPPGLSLAWLFESWNPSKAEFSENEAPSVQLEAVVAEFSGTVGIPGESHSFLVLASF